MKVLTNAELKDSKRLFSKFMPIIYHTYKKVSQVD